MSTASLSPDFQVPHFPVRRFSVDEYHRMIEVGILGEDDDLELLNGWLVPKMTRNPPHDAIMDLTHECVRRLLPDAWRIRIQSAITTADSEPEPDLAIVRGPANRYLKRHPSPEEIALIIEVAQSSLDKDRNEKGPIYAAAGIPWYWIINLVDDCVEIYSTPSGPSDDPQYQKRTEQKLGDSVSLIVDGADLGKIAVNALFGDE
ncbi:MAG: Uma2 family endonuclease [Planctomycetes bacterium]|nr:Uma2 family endonuclease [Planctomycetota bacterium]